MTDSSLKEIASKLLKILERRAVVRYSLAKLSMGNPDQAEIYAEVICGLAASGEMWDYVHFKLNVELNTIVNYHHVGLRVQQCELEVPRVSMQDKMEHIIARWRGGHATYEYAAPHSRWVQPHPFGGVWSTTNGAVDLAATSIKLQPFHGVLLARVLDIESSCAAFMKSAGVVDKKGSLVQERRETLCLAVCERIASFVTHAYSERVAFSFAD